MIRSNEAPSADAIDLEHLRFANAVTLGQAVRRCNAHATYQDQAADCVVDYFYNTFRDPLTGLPGCALVRCFQTHPFADLPREAQDAALRIDPASASIEGLRCLALLASRGEEARWNGVAGSVKHRAIPLPTTAMIERTPMISRLLEQMGLEARNIVEPHTRALMSESQYRNFGVFHVETAAGSEYLPLQQTFIEQYGIRSVVGMGGLLPSGELFAVILFARVVISEEVAALFRTIALSVKLAFLPYAANEVFTEDISGKLL
uniref:Uncharacterized protein n=1 Tax=uncultured bacterium 162 TaxID=698381 RepID=E3T748_9BACT|nr:conserved hypothetical protein [uncultured bacterium 162]